MTKPALIAAWLLTPVVVWAGAFSMGWVGAWLGGRLTWLVVGGLAGGLAGLSGWSYLVLCLRKRSVRKDSEGKSRKT
jgi:hypothetical protein